MKKSNISFITLLLATAVCQNVYAKPLEITCDLSVTTVGEEMKDNKKIQVWSSSQYDTPYVYTTHNYATVDNRLKIAAIKGLKVENYTLRTKDGKTVSRSFALVDANSDWDQAYAFYNTANPREQLAAKNYATISTKRVGTSLFIRLNVMNQGKVELTGEGIMGEEALKHFGGRLTVTGNSQEYADLIAANPGASELDLYQKLRLGSLSSFYMDCTNQDTN
jgi:hypothetical protein